MTQFFSFWPAGIVIGIAALFSISGCTSPTAAQSVDRPRPASSSLDRVTAGTPQRKSLQLYTTQPGRIEAFEEAPLHPKIAGYVEQVLVDIGDSVKRNQPLLKLDVPEMLDELKQKESLVALSEAEIQQAEAGIAAAEAAVETAAAKVTLAEAGVGRASSGYRRWEAEHSRIRQLAESGSVTAKLRDETLNQLQAAEAAQSEAQATVLSAKTGLREAEVHIRKAKADAAAAAARLDVAKSNLAETNTMLRYTTIAAPFDGVITRRNVDTGHYVHPAGGGSSKPLITIARVDKLRVSFDVPELDAAHLNPGDNATVRIQSIGKDVTAKVARTSWSLDVMNRSLRAEVDLENPEAALRPGMYSLVTILLDQRENVLIVPVSAVVRDGDKAFVCVVQSGKILRKPVELGLRSGDEIEILAGLKVDETIVLARADSLKNGQQVEVSAPQK